MNNEDLLFLLGAIVTQLGGKVKISQETQMEFTKGLTDKELLFKQNKDNSLEVVLADKKKIKEN